jgi:hypothetical protein
MSTTGFAPATSGRAIVGPVCTSLGSRYWYLSCFPDVFIAVRQPFFTGLAFALSSDNRPLVFGVMNQLVADIVTKPGRRLRKQVPARLERMSDSQLRSRPNTTIPISQLRSIVFKSSPLARFGLVFPEIILETTTGKKHVYGLMNTNFDQACSQIRQMYPHLCT